jgi:polysaccharide deacetylase family protein (PEP-CTERM system associated)
LRKINALSFDIEDWFHAEDLKEIVAYESWEKQELRVVGNTHKILNLLADKNIKATFFILGWIANKFPKLVREIASEGYEIASHGYRHCLVYNQSQKEFKEDVMKTKEILENLTGKKVIGYRAPNYSITDWGLDILKAVGYEYDSSIFPLVYHDRYNIPDFRRFPYYHSNGLKEFPITTIRILGQNFPLGGGGYFRFLPYWFFKRELKQINKKGEIFIFYLHPWELDPNQPIKPVSLMKKIRHYHNLKKVEAKLECLLNDFKFATVKECLKNQLEDKQ